ncbi:MAG: nucleotidyltransferase family protein [Ignavibacteriales bacterium]|nr:nucleotidyltransferase family protein [Ignavibacteriales bacterium]
MSEINLNSVEVINIYSKYYVKTLRIFGSMARGDFRIDSDIDLLVTFSKPVSLLQMVGLERELSAVIGRKVDLLTTKSISRYLRNRIVKESRQIYAAR